MLATNTPAGWMRSQRAAIWPVGALDDRDTFGIGQEGADVKPGRALVHAEKGERVAVTGVDDRLDFGAGAVRH